MELVIRELVSEDAQAVSEIEQESFSMPWSPRDFLEMVEADYADYYDEENRRSAQGVPRFQRYDAPAGSGDGSRAQSSTPHRICCNRFFICFFAPLGGCCQDVHQIVPNNPASVKRYGSKGP